LIAVVRVDGGRARRAAGSGSPAAGEGGPSALLLLAPLARATALGGALALLDVRRSDDDGLVGAALPLVARLPLAGADAADTVFEAPRSGLDAA
jgi:hypothetical protein